MEIKLAGTQSYQNSLFTYLNSEDSLYQKLLTLTNICWELLDSRKGRFFEQQCSTDVRTAVSVVNIISMNIYVVYCSMTSIY